MEQIYRLYLLKFKVTLFEFAQINYALFARVYKALISKIRCTKKEIFLPMKIKKQHDLFIPVSKSLMLNLADNRNVMASLPESC